MVQGALPGRWAGVAPHVRHASRTYKTIPLIQRGMAGHGHCNILQCSSRKGVCRQGCCHCP